MMIVSEDQRHDREIQTVKYLSSISRPFQLQGTSLPAELDAKGFSALRTGLIWRYDWTVGLFGTARQRFYNSPYAATNL
jgi:hypothetical protein